jgi:hypothetical protein
MKQKLGLFILLLAYGLWLPGITQPLIHMTGTVDKAELIDLGQKIVAESEAIMPMFRGMAVKFLDNLDARGEIVAYEKTRSILGTVKDLWDANNKLVAFLVCLFSIIIPALKGLLVLAAAIIRDAQLNAINQQIINAISKWSMADVFVVAIIVTYLAANATQHSEELLIMQANFEKGFYFFLAYCVLSILATQLVQRAKPTHV